MVLKIVSAVLGVAGLAWLALLFSSRAVLVDERVVEHAFYKRLECTYFTGSGTSRAIDLDAFEPAFVEGGGFKLKSQAPFTALDNQFSITIYKGEEVRPVVQ